jgi:hypothetical protein
MSLRLGLGIGIPMGYPEGGGPYSPIVAAYIARVIADGGVVESPQCVEAANL